MPARSQLDASHHRRSRRPASREHFSPRSTRCSTAGRSRPGQQRRRSRPRRRSRSGSAASMATSQGWRDVFELNFFAPLMLARGLPSRCAGQGRRSSTSPRSPATPSIPSPARPIRASKAALSALTREMAVEFAELGVRVNAVAPGEIETAMIVAGIRGADPAHPDAPPGHARRGRRRPSSISAAAIRPTSPAPRSSSPAASIFTDPSGRIGWRRWLSSRSRAATASASLPRSPIAFSKRASISATRCSRRWGRAPNSPPCARRRPASMPRR